MKKKKERLLIPFSGLKEGKHDFEFSIGAKFFEQFDQSLVDKAKVDLEVEFEKKKNLLELDIHFSGIVESICDRCSEKVDIPVEGNDFLVVKFGEEEGEDDHIMYIPESAYELDFSDPVYQAISLNLPAKIVHEDEADCDQEMLEKLKEYSLEAQIEKENESEKIDPRWSALNKLKDKD